MSEQIKFITQKLNEPPFNRNYNLVTFDDLEPLSLLQTLNDVFAHLSSQHEIDIKQEDPKVTAVRMLQFLKILKYHLPLEQREMAQGLIGGEKRIIYPLLEWLLSRLDDLKTKAYLAQFLVRIEVPAEFLSDPEVSELYTKYEHQLEEFKRLHKMKQQSDSSTINAEEIRKDIERMEEEKLQLQNRLQIYKKRAEQEPENEELFNACKRLREERDKRDDIKKQINQQQELVEKAQAQLDRLNEEFKTTKENQEKMTPDNVISILEDELKLKKEIANVKQPKEIQEMRELAEVLQKILTDPPLTDEEYEELNKELQEVNDQIEKEVAKQSQPIDKQEDDNLALYKQQAAKVANRKEELTQTLKEVIEQEKELKEDVAKKQKLVDELQANPDLNEEDMKKYVEKLRGISETYKAKRNKINEMKAEAGLLERTAEILTNRNKEAKENLEKAEKEKGISGYRQIKESIEEVSDVKAKLDEEKGKSLESMSESIQILTQKLNEQKDVLAPLIKQIRPLRNQEMELRAEYDKKKVDYDALQAKLEGKRLETEASLKLVNQECMATESRFHYLNFMISQRQAMQERVSSELKLYKGGRENQKKKSLRDLYTRKIQEAENAGKALKEKQKIVKANHDTNLQQMRLWEDLQKLLHFKLQLAEEQAKLREGMTLPTTTTSTNQSKDKTVNVITF